MHMQGTPPQTMQDNPHYEDVVSEIRDYLARTRDWLPPAASSPDESASTPELGLAKRVRII
jgi:dihydropteroate synthase